MATERILISGGTVLTMDDGIGILPKADILVENGRIAAVASELGAEDAEVIDASGCIVTPGFVDGHRHMWQTFLRGALPNCTLSTYMRDVFWVLAPHVRPEHGEAGTLLGALECLNAGITTVFDWSHALPGQQDADARLDGLLASGIRGFFAPSTPAGAEWYSWEKPLAHPEHIRRIRAERLGSDSGRIRLGAALRSPGQVPDAVIEKDWATARELGVPISIHAGVRLPDTNPHEVSALHRLGLLASDVHFAHGCEFTDEEVALLADAGAGVTLSPNAELTAGLGHVRPARFVAAGIPTGLSSDATAMAPGDMFSLMRAAFAAARNEQLPLDPNAEYLPTFEAIDALRLATIDGARAIGLGDVCGSLTPGKAADIVLVRSDAVNTAPVVDPVATVVLSADTSNVDTVLVEGEIVKRGGTLARADLAHVISVAEQARDEVLGAADWRR